MKGGHDQMKSRCGFYSKLEYCEGVVEEFGGEVGGKLPLPPLPIDETLSMTTVLQYITYMFPSHIYMA